MSIRLLKPALLLMLLGMSIGLQAAPMVLFDQGHGQRFVIERFRELDLSGLAEQFRKGGFNVVSSTGRLTAAELAEAQALVISGPFKRFDKGEQQAILEFVERGGHLAMMLHVGPINGPLLKHLGISVSMGVLHERRGLIAGRDTDFAVPDLPAHPLTEGVDNINYYGTWALLGRDKRLQVVAQTSTASWLDLNRNRQHDHHEPIQPFAVALAGEYGAGRLVVFGDDALFQNRYLEGANLRLAQNLVRWLSPAGLERADSRGPLSGAALAQLSYD